MDLTTEKGRYISAALALASERPWDQVTLAEIAARAGSTLVGLKAHFATKTDIVSAFMGLVDDEVLARAPQRGAEQTSRDALFEVVMSRFDVLEPWKPALKSILKGTGPEPALLARGLASQRWMLEAAGVGSGGLPGAVRTAGLASVYTAVLRVWLDDDDPGQARTMAALDRRLRRGEQVLRRSNEFIGGLGRVAGAICGAFGTVRARAEEARGRRGSQPEQPGGGASPEVPLSV
jgi:ubiquinone biosynthesis protein COQ9